jgi:hypothetical protein
MRILRFIGIFFALLPLATIADTAVQDKSYAELMRNVAEKKAKLIADLNKLNHGTVSTVAQTQLNAHWESARLLETFNQHYHEVEKALAQVGIRDEHSFLDIIWAQYKAVVAEENLEKLISEFIHDALAQITPLQEQTLTAVFTYFEQDANQIFQDAQKDVKQQFDEIFSRRFHDWPQVHVGLAPVKVKADDIKTVETGVSGGMGARPAAMSGAVLLVLSRQLRTLIVRRMTNKIVGKLAGKAIPYVGWALLGYDVITAAGAKADMEKMLRESFMHEYQSLFTPQAVWKESRDNTLREFNLQLQRWLELNKEKTRELINAAELFETPHFKDYVSKRQEQGVSLDELATELNDIKTSFGPLATVFPIDSLYEIKALMPVQAPPEFLTRLVDKFGHQLVPLYERYGSKFFMAAFKMGVNQTHALVNQDQDVWLVYEKFYQYLDENSAEDAKQGFFLASSLGLDLSPPWTENLFSALYQFQQTLTPLLQRNHIDLPKLKQVLADMRLLAMLQSLEQQRQDLFVAVFDHLSTLEMARYLAPERLQAFVKLYQHQSQQQGMSAEQYARAVQQEDSLLSIYLDYGADGVLIWNHYVSQNSGQVQRNLAHKALVLYKDGWAMETCLDAEAVNYADKLRSWPLGGVLFKFSYPVYKGLGLVGSLILVVMILALLSAIVYWLRRIFSHAKTPPPPSVAYPSYPLSTTTHYTIEALENKKLPPAGKPE